MRIKEGREVVSPEREVELKKSRNVMRETFRDILSKAGNVSEIITVEKNQ